MKLEKHKIYYLQTAGIMGGVQWIMPISGGFGWDKTKPVINMLICVELTTLQNLPKYDNLNDYKERVEIVTGYFGDKIEYSSEFPKDAFWKHWCIMEDMLDEPLCICLPLDVVQHEYPNLMMVGSSNVYARGIPDDILISYKREFLLKKILENDR